MREPEHFFLVIRTHDSEENNLAGWEIGSIELDDDWSATSIGNMVLSIVRSRIRDTERQ